MLTITGGKLTTWRRMAKLTVDRLVERDTREAPCRTHEIPLGQAVAEEDLPRVEGVPEESYPALAARYGYAAHDVLALAAERGELAQPIVPGQPDLLAEAALAARREQARTVGDVLLRRTRLGLLAARELSAARPGEGGAGVPARAVSPPCSRVELGLERRGARARRSRASPRRRTPRGCGARERSAVGPMPAVAGDRVLELGARPWLMGVVNASPDSFSDGGRHGTLEERARSRGSWWRPALRSSTSAGSPPRTGARPLRWRRSSRASCRWSSGVAEVDGMGEPRTHPPGRLPWLGGHLQAGGRGAPRSPRGRASSTTSRGLRDPALARVCAETGAALVVMHTAAAPRVRRQDPELYGDVVGEVLAFLRARVDGGARRRGVAREQLILDPGPDFAKTPAQTVELLAARGAPARARPAAAAGDLAQGLRRRAHWPRRPANGSPARSPRSRTGSTWARTCTACTTSPLRPTSSPCARRCAASAAPERDLVLAEELRHERAELRAYLGSACP